MKRTAILVALAAAAAAALAACVGDQPDEIPGASGSASDPGHPVDPDDQPIPEEAYDVLSERVVDYNEALRTASLKLLGRLPTLEEIKDVASGGKAAYEARLDAMLAAPAFAQQMFRWWQDIMRQGGEPGDDRHGAPALAAQLIVEGRSFLEVLTTTDNCATFDAATSTFAAAPCDSGAPTEAGVLTNPGVMRQFHGNMAFRRVRWVQEIFACQELPAEQGDAPQDVGGGVVFQGPWPFTSISDAPVNFRNTEGAICANCHQTLNHMAPLFGRFGASGLWQEGFGVSTNVGGQDVPSELGHWLPPEEPTAWRFGQPAASLPELGQVMAADPAVHSCMVARAWNFAMSKEDIVSAGAIVPPEVIAPFVEQFRVNFNLKETLRAMFKGEDFIKR